MNTQIKQYVESLLPKQLGLKQKIKVSRISKLGMGTGNLNYLVVANKKKFVYRMNMDLKDKKKSRREFEALKIVEKYKIGPIARVLDETRKSFDSDFIILDYIEGKTVDKTKEYFSDMMVRKIARLLATIHSIKLTPELKNLPKMRTSYRDEKQIIRDYLAYIKSKTNNVQLVNMIEDSATQLLRLVPPDRDNVNLVLTQGDFCEQNVIVHNGEYKLIDFEDLGLIDPAAEVSHVLLDFGRPFEEKQREIFFSEYLTIKKDRLLRGRVEIYSPLLSLSIFLWSIEHILKSKNKQMHKEYLKNNDSAKDFQYLKTTFKRALKAGVIDKKYKSLHLEKILK